MQVGVRVRVRVRVSYNHLVGESVQVRLAHLALAHRRGGLSVRNVRRVGGHLVRVRVRVRGRGRGRGRVR